MQKKTDGNRILLALDISPRSRAALEAAAALAAELDAELAGLFIEDLNLLRLSALPFTREIGLFSSASHPIALHQVEQALHREAGEVQRLLAEVATRLSLHWSFNVRRGLVATELLSQAGEFDLVVLGKRARQGMRPLDKEMTTHEKPQNPSPVLVVFDGSSAAHKLLLLALRLAQARRAELRVLVPAATDQAYTHNIAKAQTLLAGAVINTPIYRRIASCKIEQFATVAREEACGVLLLNVDGHLQLAEGFATLLNEIECPVVLVRQKSSSSMDDDA